MKEKIIEFYIKQDLTKSQVAKILKISKNSVSRFLTKYNIHKTKTQIQNKRVESINKTYREKDIISKRKQTCIQKYGVDSYSKTKEYKEQYQKTCLERYGESVPSRSPKIAKKISKAVKKSRSSGIPQEKSRQTCIKRYGVDNASKLEVTKNKMKQTNLKKYGVEASTQNPKIQEKRYRTQLKNNTLNIAISKEEDRIYELLLTKFDKEDIVRQYKSEVYPFKCDFYIRSLDLYIEYQGGWFHQNEPYDKNNPSHIDKLKQLYDSYKETDKKIIKTWTKRDPLKRETARKNKLNYLEIFGAKDIKKIESL